MPRHRHSKASCRALVSKNIRKHFKAGKSQRQSIAIALNQARKMGCTKYLGGGKYG